MSTRSGKLLGQEDGFGAPRLVPQREFHPVPQAQFVVDDAQVVLYDVFGRPDGIGHFSVLQAFGNELDDSLFTFTGDTSPIASTCRHACLRYNRVASLTRLIPPVIPKRRNNRLK